MWYGVRNMASGNACEGWGPQETIDLVFALNSSLGPHSTVIYYYYYYLVKIDLKINAFSFLLLIL